MPMSPASLLALARAQARGTHTDEEWRAMKVFFRNRCVRCKKRFVLRIDGEGLTKDHIIPLSHPESSDGIRNIQPLCSECNGRKRNKIYDYREEWAGTIPEYLPDARMRTIMAAIKDNREICSRDNPFSKERNLPGTRWFHEETEEIGRQEDGYPAGDLQKIRCKVCGITWAEELPQ